MIQNDSIKKRVSIFVLDFLLCNYEVDNILLETFTINSCL